MEQGFFFLCALGIAFVNLVKLKIKNYLDILEVITVNSIYFNYWDRITLKNQLNRHCKGIFSPSHSLQPHYSAHNAL